MPGGLPRWSSPRGMRATPVAAKDSVIPRKRICRFWASNVAFDG